MDNNNLIQATIHFHQYPIKVDVYSNPSHQHSVIILPALGITIQKYQKLIGLLVDHHFNVIAADYPHCGRNTPLVSSEIDFGYKDLLTDFIPQLEQISRDTFGQEPILLGHSLGGHLATLYAQNHAIKVIGIATGNIGLKYWDLNGKFNILKAVTIINAMILKDGYFAGYKIAFGNRETKTLMRDWSKVIFTGNYKHIQNDQSVSHQPALFIHLKEDDFAPMSSMLGLSRYFDDPTVKTLNLTNTLKGNQHSAWIKQPDEIVKLIKSWTH
ncbi:alpha/beta hydrolase [Acinetobacter sp. TGL-Y2]|uniref:alpha/beta fold hydrolase n=1 Tax=Acinetobacter sp. TGL-Y2 TaxID=1407071 RepID=UPI0007A65225|nr:alpha/beta fold hydrolase [Acinetobacter sp. TGL-Y2]AMW79004.1 alpha/beta hydrolase [Acinetobacter sp. TGL-Y2]